MLLVATLSVLVAWGAMAPGVQPSALRVEMTSVIALLAPLFWPGIAATPARTALRVAAWSAAAAGLAAVLLWLPGHAAQPLPRALVACGMLLLILLPTHLLAAVVEAMLRHRSGDAEAAREMAGRTAAIVLALLGTLPLWLGTLAELLSARHPWIIDAALGASPLTHLAVASGNDLLRNEWFYQHSNLAALQFSYPELGTLVGAYATLAGVLALVALAIRRPRHRVANAADFDSTMERTP
jgi:hypothetical protein